MLTQRHERLNALSALAQGSKYLEIGVSHGATFLQVQAPYKVAVDPKFRFDYHAMDDATTFFHEVTSDRFFTGLAFRHGAFDLIYLDGLHTFEQTFRDFCASLRFSHPRTIWLIDDTCPTGWFAASPHRRFSRRCRRWLHIRDRAWMGDVFKVVFAIHDFFPQFSYATFPGHGQTVIWTQTRSNDEPTWNSLREISDMNYGNFLRFKETHLCIHDAATVIEMVRRGLAAG